MGLDSFRSVDLLLKKSSLIKSGRPKVFPKCPPGIGKSQAFPAPKDKNDRQSAGSGQGAFPVC